MRYSPILVATLTTTFAIVSAQAQQPANNGGGRALDASQQVGTGGYNVPSGQVDYRARNDLITGNVQGGRQFRGEIDYGAPGAFGAASATDDLFRFRADSLPSSPARLDSARIYSREQRAITSVYGNFTDVPAYRTGGRIMNQGLVPGNDGLQFGGPSTSRVTGLIAPNAITSGINPARPSTGSFDIVTGADGTALQVQASPLLGVRRAPLPRNPLVNPSDPTGQLPDSDEPSNAIDADIAPEFRVDTEANALSSGVGTSGLYAQQGAQVAPGIVLAQQMNAAYDPQRSNETIDERIARLEQQIYSPLGSRNVEPGQDVYFDLLTAMKTGGVEESQDPSRFTAFGGDTNSLEGELESPTQTQMEQAEEQRRLALERVIEAAAARDAEGEEAAADGDQEDGEAESVGMLVDQLNYDLPRLETLAGQRESRVNETIRKAEADLAAGKYFAAEGLYRQALTDQPNDPLIRAGLIHAQLGAGMIRSAAYNLRLLFEEHPELIAARYDAKLLPAATRLKWVQNELQKMIDDPSSNADAGLMLAYLGYQVDSPQLIRYGLAKAEARAPKDPLFPLLRRIWLDESAGRPAR